MLGFCCSFSCLFHSLVKTSYAILNYPKLRLETVFQLCKAVLEVRADFRIEGRGDGACDSLHVGSGITYDLMLRFLEGNEAQL